MKILVMLAWRNLWRNKRRSIVVISSIALGIFAMIFSAAFMNGMNNQMVENTISTSLGHIAIHTKGFQANMKLEYNFEPGPGLLKALDGQRLVKSYAPRVKVQGMARSSEASRGVLIIGIDPRKEKHVSKIYDYMVKDGQSEFLRSSGDDSVLISRSLAKKLDLLVGDKLVLMLQDEKKDIVGVGMTVRGFYQTPIESFDKFVVFTGIRKLQEITGLGANISEINILLKNKNYVDRVKRALAAAAGPKLEILSWKDMAPNLVSAIALFNTMMYIFFAIVFVTVVFSVANTLVMAIMERFHEIGVMKSIGTRPSWIFTLVILEAGNLGIVGLASGLSAGMAVVWVLSVTGIDFSFYMESMRTWGTGSIIYPSIKAMDLAVAAGIVFATTWIAALYPAFKAARIKPLDALNYV